MPANTSRMGLREFRKRGEAYSLRKIATARPRGKAISMAKKVVVRVALSKGKMPKLPDWGCHLVPVKNSHRFTSGLTKKSQASLPISNTIARVVRTEKTPQKNKNPLISTSKRCGRLDKSIYCYYTNKGLAGGKPHVKIGLIISGHPVKPAWQHSAHPLKPGSNRPLRSLHLHRSGRTR